MKITAVSGWAIPTEWFSKQIQKYFVDSEINVIYPSDPFDALDSKSENELKATSWSVSLITNGANIDHSRNDGSIQSWVYAKSTGSIE